MIVAAFLFLSAITRCAQTQAPPVPPVPAALNPPTQDIASAHSPEGPFAPPEKRLLKYILPSSQAWMNGEDAAIPTEQEGIKRGYNSRNYLRFGRSDEEKRGGRNFLRFGRGDFTDFETDDELDDALEKRGRNFLRFGRSPSRNFLRFGRSDGEELDMTRGPMEFAEGLHNEVEDIPAEEKRGAHKNYLRFGRGNRNFLRFGRGEDRNFLRFGRSVDRQLTCEGCEDEQKTLEITSTPSPTPIQPMSRAKHEVSAVRSGDNTESFESGESNTQRFKRSAPGYYDYVAFSPRSPASWALDVLPEEEVIDDSSSEESPDMKKRSYNRSFLRFGRNRNFLRFGKRDEADSSSNEPMEYPRYVRAPARNFLRFG
ncbi:uncharacterized protein FMRFa isoform X2 [Panulirus ornatus]